MPRTKELGLAFLLNSLLFLMLILMVYPYRSREAALPESLSIIEYQRLDPLTFASIVGSQAGEEEPVNIPPSAVVEPPLLVDPPPYLPERSEESEPLIWENTVDESFVIPDLQLEETFPNQFEIVSQRNGTQEELNNIDFQWKDGSDRDILYIPTWNERMDREMDEGIQELKIFFSLTGEGYVFDPRLDDRISLNSAWENLILNWISQFVFEPGQEGEGAISIRFVPAEI